MFHVIRRADLTTSPNRAARFEGEPYGAGISFFLVDNEPGQGAALHRHPYPETCIVRAGRAGFTVDGERVEAGPGDVVVVEAGTPHGFRNLGPGRLELVCIHAAPRIATEWLETDAPGAR